MRKYSTQIKQHRYRASGSVRAASAEYDNASRNRRHGAAACDGGGEVADKNQGQKYVTPLMLRKQYYTTACWVCCNENTVITDMLETSLRISYLQ